MRVRITRHPIGSVDGVNVECYQVGCVYDIAPVLADYLILNGFAEVEMRSRDEPPPVERRRMRWSDVFQRFWRSSGGS